MAEKICIHCYAAGKVQGVWFRASTKAEAVNLGLRGWVRNLPDGRVEVLACGEKDKVMQLYAWLQQGPRLANVTEVSCDEQPWKAYDSFDVL